MGQEKIKQNKNCFDTQIQKGSPSLLYNYTSHIFKILTLTRKGIVCKITFFNLIYR